MPPEVRQQLTGHSDLSSHRIYTHLEVDTLGKAIAALPGLAMTYGQITNWMSDGESGVRLGGSTATTRFEHGKTTNAAVGEIALYTVAEELLSRVPNRAGKLGLLRPLGSASLPRASSEIEKRTEGGITDTSGVSPTHCNCSRKANTS